MDLAEAQFFDLPFEVHGDPISAGPILFNSPHSGALYPEAFLAASRLEPQALRRSEDMFVDQLFAPVVAQGQVMMRAHFPRAFLDVNREPFELDQTMFDEPLPDYVNVRSLRVAAGLGTIAKVVAEGVEIYKQPLRVSEALARIDALYHPYHAKLAELLRFLHRKHGFALLVDCHSMPSLPLRDLHRRADIVIGDRFGTSCMGLISDVVEQSLTHAGYKVARNRPFAGGFITEHYGQPAQGLHAIQIEINRALYMDERNQAKHRGFSVLQQDLMGMASGLIATLGGALFDRQAAE
jgi:N-formylglutamate amidohydrolase